MERLLRKLNKVFGKLLELYKDMAYLVDGYAIFFVYLVDLTRNKRSLLKNFVMCKKCTHIYDIITMLSLDNLATERG